MKENKPQAVFREFKNLKTLKQRIKTQQAAPPAVRSAAPSESFSSLLSVKNTPSTTTQPSDKELFLQAVRDVKPLKPSQRHHEQQQRKKQAAQQAEQFKRRQQHALGHPPLASLTGLSDHYTSDYDDLPRQDYLNPMCGTDVLRNLKKGRWPIMASIDLHGATVDQARLRLEYFLQHSLVEGFKCVRIVHGIGYGSKTTGPVLPATVRRWLSQLDFVLAYTDCAPREGGEGAVKVLLRTSAHLSI